MQDTRFNLVSAMSVTAALSIIVLLTACGGGGGGGGNSKTVADIDGSEDAADWLEDTTGDNEAPGRNSETYAGTFASPCQLDPANTRNGQPVYFVEEMTLEPRTTTELSLEYRARYFDPSDPDCVGPDIVSFTKDSPANSFRIEGQVQVGFNSMLVQADRVTISMAAGGVLRDDRNTITISPDSIGSGGTILINDVLFFNTLPVQASSRADLVFLANATRLHRGVTELGADGYPVGLDPEPAFIKQ